MAKKTNSRILNVLRKNGGEMHIADLIVEATYRSSKSMERPTITQMQRSPYMNKRLQEFVKLGMDGKIRTDNGIAYLVKSNPKRCGKNPNAEERRASLPLTRKEAQGHADSTGKPVHILKPSKALGYRAAPGYRIIAESTWKANKDNKHYKGCHVETVRPKTKKNPYGYAVRSNPGKKGCITIPKGKRAGETFTKGGKKYKVVSYLRNGKRVRYARKV